MKEMARSLGLAIGAATAAFVVVLMGLSLVGYPAVGLLREWVLGAVGTPTDIALALKNACPLILTGLAVGVAFRCGVWNIGAEGQSILGAICAVAFATRIAVAGPAWLLIPLALACGVFGGAAWAGIAAALQRWRGVPVVLSTILLNFIAISLLGMLLEGPHGLLHAHGTDDLRSDQLGVAYRLPLLTATGHLHIGVLIAVGTAGVAWLVQARTAFGFELLVTGLNAEVATLAGIPVARRQLGVMLLSGAFAGLAGAIQVVAAEGYYLAPSPLNYGFVGIAVALLGRLHPAGIVCAAVFFGLLDQGAAAVEISEFHLPQPVADVVKGAIVLAMLVGAAWALRQRSRGRQR